MKKAERLLLLGESTHQNFPKVARKCDRFCREDGEDGTAVPMYGRKSAGFTLWLLLGW
jgi:hypothetical protein